MSVRAQAVRWLSRRDYTTAEIRAKLVEQEFDPAEVDAAISALIQEGLLNDQRVASAHARTASQIKHRGRLRVRRELEACGIDRALVAQVLAELPDADEAAAIEKFLLRKRLPQTLDPAARRRLFGQLLRRGFSVDAISRALRRHGPDE